MNKKNSVIVFLILLGGYFLLRNKKKGGIIVNPLISIKPYAKQNKIAYKADLNTPIYTFINDTLIELLDYDEIKGIYKIQFGNGVKTYGFISEHKIIYK